MKQARIVLGLLLVAVLVAGLAAEEKKKKDKASKEAALQAAGLPLREDLDGKPVKADEPFLAQRQLKDGRLAVYRKNEKDVAALVKGLKEDGVTEAKLLEPKNWLLWSCQAYGYKKCSGKCGNQQCVWVKYNLETARIAQLALAYQGYCACR